MELELDTLDKVGDVLVVDAFDGNGPTVGVLRREITCSVLLCYRSGDIAVDCMCVIILLETALKFRTFSMHEEIGIPIGL